MWSFTRRYMSFMYVTNWWVFNLGALQTCFILDMTESLENT